MVLVSKNLYSDRSLLVHRNTVCFRVLFLPRDLAELKHWLSEICLSKIVGMCNHMPVNTEYVSSFPSCVTFLFVTSLS